MIYNFQWVHGIQIVMNGLDVFLKEEQNLEKRGFFDDMLREFDEMGRDMERMYHDEFKDIEKKVPKRIIKRIYNSRGCKSERYRSNCLWIFNDNRS